MNNLGFYKLLSFILLPIAAIIGLFALIALLAALANPSVLLGVFLLGSVAVYVFTSFRFFTKGVEAAQPLKPSLRDWIRVNAFVSIAFAILSIVNASTLLANPILFHDTIAQSIAMQQKMNPGAVPEALMIKMMKGIMYFLIVLGGLLIIHIITTFRLLKQYKHVFDKA